ncbi:hypothetical protein EYF80_052695 [Liparis tanakae]|uniref:Uncharacterized protein n=1 Tax=Liparis tanakae TaxID=230148 RepID=A0A4Z2F8D2_9TELE|nr:hypothetical protein EYF80_052695 [Liparis tanakae]
MQVFTNWIPVATRISNPHGHSDSSRRLKPEEAVVKAVVTASETQLNWLRGTLLCLSLVRKTERTKRGKSGRAGKKKKRTEVAVDEKEKGGDE